MELQDFFNWREIKRFILPLTLRVLVGCALLYGFGWGFSLLMMLLTFVR